MTLFFLKTSMGKNSYKSGNIVTILCLPVINFPIQLMGSKIADILKSGPNIATLDKLTFPQQYIYGLNLLFFFLTIFADDDFVIVFNCFAILWKLGLKKQFHFPISMK